MSVSTPLNVLAPDEVIERLTEAPLYRDNAVELLLDGPQAHNAMLDAIMRAKPTAAKGQYIKKIVVASTMGPGIRLDLNEALATKAAA